MKYTKTLIGLIASVMILTGCSTGGGTAVTIYDKDGNKVQETTNETVMLNQAYKMAEACEKAKNSGGNVALGIIDPASLKGMAASAQTEYMRTLPMLHMAGALKAATAKGGNECQQGIVAYYNHLNVAKKENSALWRKLIGIGGFIGGAYVIGNSVENIVSSLSSTGSTTNTISDSRVNQDSGNNYSSPAGIANTQMEVTTEFAPVEPVAPVE